jgi:CRISPR/Cas system-associated endonuclease Cas3-HD
MDPVSEMSCSFVGFEKVAEVVMKCTIFRGMGHAVYQIQQTFNGLHGVTSQKFIVYACVLFRIPGHGQSTIPVAQNITHHRQKPTESTVTTYLLSTFLDI